MNHPSEIELLEEAEDRLMALEDERLEQEEIIASIRRYHQFNPDAYDFLPAPWLCSSKPYYEEY